MKQIFSKAIGALALGSAVIAAVPAEARDWGGHGGGHGYYGGHGGYHGGYGYRGGYRGYRGYYGDNAGLALGAGIVGLAIGAAVASDRGYGYDRGYPPPPPYGYYDDYAPYAYDGYGYRYRY